MSGTEKTGRQTVDWCSDDDRREAKIRANIFEPFRRL